MELTIDKFVNDVYTEEDDCKTSLTDLVKGLPPETQKIIIERAKERQKEFPQIKI